MELIGSILKETTRISYVRQRKKAKRDEIQQRTLFKLIKKAKNTAFGAAHGFKEMHKNAALISEFKSSVPITNYEDFHTNWLHLAIQGKKDIIWPGRINYFALSSGTSAGTSKKIPVSDKMLRKFHKTTIQQVSGLTELQLPPSFYESNALIVGGSTHLKKVNKSYHGDLSGILAKNKSFVLTPFTKPTARIAKMTDWNKKVEAIIEQAPNWDIGVIAGVPSWVSQLLERIIERYQLANIHEIWPNLRVYSHGGIFLKPYKQKLDQLFGRPMVYQNTYLASEGYFAYQRDFLKGGMQLMLSNGVFYEFVEEKYFDLLSSNQMDQVQTLAIDQVQERTPYALIISTCSGLWRYSLGDTIEFTDIASRTIKITGRISFHLSDHGEHLSDSNLIHAIELLSKEENASIEEFTVYSNKQEQRQYWYIGANKLISTANAAHTIDESLKQLNDDYETVRKHILKSPKVRVLPTRVFYEFMEKCGRMGGQNKFPHVLTKEQNQLWLNHLGKDD
ncbi:MAG: GH3 auxin-responsive promoter family protein [Flavobacteriales bacterium]|nr:GH3 auxin-responsive promoter family protein [Flavobacteriales bacterium]PIE87105.1 MAG: GH3 auxin-responsive promoter [Bacteroidota bacterium]